jgi:hypothetical protein
MANRILMAEGWEARIQSKMGVDPAYLPNADISQPDVITVAEANIIAQIPDYASLVDDDKVYLEAAVVCECASLLCPSMAARLPVRQQGPNETHELAIDWDKKKTEFEVERDGYIGKILPPFTLLHFGLSQ